jgi:hypothetical protein
MTLLIVGGQSGQSAQFWENNGTPNASLYVGFGILSFKSSELLVL